MLKLEEHPTVRRCNEKLRKDARPSPPPKLDVEWLRTLCLEAGANDVGFVEIDRPEIADEREDILTLFPYTKTLVSFVCRMNREPIRSPARSVANLEFHNTGDEVNYVARKIVAALEERGARAGDPGGG